MTSRQSERFFQNPEFPFIECRYTQSSQSVYKPHMHTTVSVGAVDRGEVTYSVGDRNSRLQPGALALINPEVLHSCNTEHGAVRSYYMLYMDMEWCHKVQQSLWRTDVFLPFRDIHIEDAELYLQYCETLQALLTTRLHLQDIEQRLFDLASAIFRKGCTGEQPAQEKGHDLQLLKQLLKEDLQKDYTLASLADQFDVNPYTLLRRFKSQTGLTPHAYRMNCRVEKARSLLRQGTDISEVIYLTGFFDQSHLNRSFKAVTTVTPNQYRVNFIQ